MSFALEGKSQATTEVIFWLSYPRWPFHRTTERMIIRELRKRPLNWGEYQRAVVPRWSLPWHAIDLAFQWLAWLLGRWAFLEVLEYLSALSVLFGVFFYYSEAGDRKKQKHYQAWQVINTAQGKGGSGGRIEALQELNNDHISLVGVDISGAALEGIQLRHADLGRASILAGDLRDCSLEASNLQSSDLQSANLRGCRLGFANLSRANLEDADLADANLEFSNLTNTNLRNADLSHTDLRGIQWHSISAIDSANVYGARNAPAGFIPWAMQHGAMSRRDEDE